MARLNIEVIYATPERQVVITVELAYGACAIDALRASSLPETYPEIDSASPVLGVFGRRVKPGARLQDGDRLEIYRPLLVDPKDARRAKVSAKRRPGR